jgi:predicted nucleic acid-binding protein
MPEWLQIVIAIVIAVAALMVGISLGRRRRSTQLREQFGPEYDRAVSDTGDRRRAEEELDERRRRRAELDIRELSPEERDRLGEEWRQIQLRFVDDPHGVIGAADRLIAEIMRTRGYPVEDFEQRAADISVDHPTVVENYRAAHATAQLHADGQASTEDLRQAMVHYRALADELLGSGVVTDAHDRPSAGDQPDARATEEPGRAADRPAGERDDHTVHGDPGDRRTEVS